VTTHWKHTTMSQCQPTSTDSFASRLTFTNRDTDCLHADPESQNDRDPVLIMNSQVIIYK